MNLYGLIGFPLTHSFSEKYFKEKFRKENIQNTDYKLFPIKEITEIKKLLAENPHLKGFNVTIPYKEAIIPFLNKLDKTAEEIGAVNCVKIQDGQLIGYYTDYLGFEKSLKPLLKKEIKNALILGNGGSAKAVKYVLRKLGISFLIVSRTAKENCITYKELNEVIVKQNLLIINTTPLGMYPKIEAFPPIPYQYLSENHICYDLVYNPTKTQFLKKAEQNGATIKNGLEMLEVQAEESWKIWKNENENL
jgi:shikimate dehydrogenase